MKLIAVMNGWKDAPHHWWRYLLLPYHFGSAKPAGWFVVSLFGFAFFFEYPEWTR
jgi:hypothetical protein